MPVLGCILGSPCCISDKVSIADVPMFFFCSARAVSLADSVTCAPGFATYLADVTGVPQAASGRPGSDWRGALESAFQSRLAALAEDASMPLCVLLPGPEPLTGQRALAVTGEPSSQRCLPSHICCMLSSCLRSCIRTVKGNALACGSNVRPITLPYTAVKARVCSCRHSFVCTGACGAAARCPAAVLPERSKNG
jgi:hypothetical protein